MIITAAAAKTPPIIKDINKENWLYLKVLLLVHNKGSR